MTQTPHGSGIGPETPATTTRSTRRTRRTRRLAIIGALALVLVAGAVLAGMKMTGARSGTITSSATEINIAVKCSYIAGIERSPYSAGTHSKAALTFTADASAHFDAGTTVQVSVRTGISPATYVDQTTDTNTVTATSGAYVGAIKFDYPSGGTTYAVSWGSTNHSADPYYSLVWCPRV